MFDTRNLVRSKEFDHTEEYTYRDPLLSIWQSAANFVAMNSSPALLARMDVQPQRLAANLMAPVHAVQRHAKGVFSSAKHILTDITDFMGITGNCAKLASEFLWAEVTHQQAKADKFQSEIKKSVCDGIGWAECLEQYLLYKAKLGPNPYRKNMNIMRNIPDQVRIGIVGDWGTGEGIAVSVLQAVQDNKIDMLIHLGDIYYAGTQTEVQHNFLQICRDILGPNMPLYSLCGNHDMYSGGVAYYSLLDQIGQEASYFCLRNTNWQILAMDTGNRDQDPLTVSTNMTSLNDSELDFHFDKFQSAGDRKTILMSHHQLFSPFGSVGQMDHDTKSAYNPNLYSVFQGFLPKVEWWFWGHEHTLAVYDPYMGVKQARCLGASAIPVFIQQQSYTVDRSLKCYQNGPAATWNVHAQLGNNGTDYNHCFGILELSGPKATATYYEVPIGTRNFNLLTRD
jgi:predicted phosphodiesterase